MTTHIIIVLSLIIPIPIILLLFLCFTFSPFYISFLINIISISEYN